MIYSSLYILSLSQKLDTYHEAVAEFADKVGEATFGEGFGGPSADTKSEDVTRASFDVIDMTAHLKTLGRMRAGHVQLKKRPTYHTRIVDESTGAQQDVDLIDVTEDMKDIAHHLSARVTH